MTPSRHRRALALLLATVAGTASLAFAAGRLTSPDQRAARSAAPDRTPLELQIQRRDLREEVSAVRSAVVNGHRVRPCK